MVNIEELTQNKTLVIYTKEGCPTCNRAKAYYTRHTIPFEERDVNQNEQWRLEATELSPNATVPVIIENGTVTVGWQGREG